MVRSIIIAGLMLLAPMAVEARSFCQNWPVFQLSDGTRACKALFGPLRGQGFTAATGKFHMLSKVETDAATNQARALSLCRVYRKEILNVTRQLGLKRPKYIAIIQTWKIGQASAGVDKVQNYTTLVDKRCRKVVQ